MEMMQALVERIVELLEHTPEAWEFGRYTAVHRSSGVEVWIANRVYGLDIRVLGGGVTLVPGWLQRRRLYRAVREAACIATARRLQLEPAERS